MSAIMLFFVIVAAIWFAIFVLPFLVELLVRLLTSGVFWVAVLGLVAFGFLLML